MSELRTGEYDDTYHEPSFYMAAMIAVILIEDEVVHEREMNILTEMLNLTQPSREYAAWAWFKANPEYMPREWKAQAQRAGLETI